MKLIRNLFFLFAATVFAIASFVLALFNYNPFTANRQEFISFYLSFFIALSGIMAISIYYARMKTQKSQTIFSQFWPSIRQALFLSLSATVLLILRGLRILDWLTAISIIIVAILLELFFQTKKGFAK